MVKESQEIRQILDFLTLRDCFVWRNNTGQFQKEYTNSKGIKKRYFIKTGLIGSPDIIGFTPSGMFIGVEVKTAKSSKSRGLSLEQMAFKQAVDKRGGLFFLADKGLAKFIDEVTCKI